MSLTLPCKQKIEKKKRSVRETLQALFRKSHRFGTTLLAFWVALVTARRVANTGPPSLRTCTQAMMRAWSLVKRLTFVFRRKSLMMPPIYSYVYHAFLKNHVCKSPYLMAFCISVAWSSSSPAGINPARGLVTDEAFFFFNLIPTPRLPP